MLKLIIFNYIIWIFKKTDFTKRIITNVITVSNSCSYSKLFLHCTEQSNIVLWPFRSNYKQIPNVMKIYQLRFHLLGLILLQLGTIYGHTCRGSSASASISASISQKFWKFWKILFQKTVHLLKAKFLKSYSDRNKHQLQGDVSTVHHLEK